MLYDLNLQPSPKISNYTCHILVSVPDPISFSTSLSSPPELHALQFYNSQVIMASRQTRSPSFFLVPDEKINYEPTVKLGNVIYRVTQPDRILFSPTLATPPLALGVDPSEKELKKYKISPKASNSSEYGLFAKILDFFNFGANISHKGSEDDSESYEIKRIKFLVFAPPPPFFAALAKKPSIEDVLENGAGHVFLITGVAVASGVKFKSSTTRGNENGGSFGVHVHGLEVGPSVKRSKKMKLEISYTDDGPTVLGFRVQKLQLKDGALSAEPYEDGSYFGNDNEDARYIDFNATLDEYNKYGMENEAVRDELFAEEYDLYLPNE
jgi:hypothetical protein